MGNIVLESDKKILAEMYVSCFHGQRYNQLRLIMLRIAKQCSNFEKFCKIIDRLPAKNILVQLRFIQVPSTQKYKYFKQHGHKPQYQQAILSRLKYHKQIEEMSHQNVSSEVEKVNWIQPKNYKRLDNAFMYPETIHEFNYDNINEYINTEKPYKLGQEPLKLNYQKKQSSIAHRCEFNTIKFCKQNIYQLILSFFNFRRSHYAYLFKYQHQDFIQDLLIHSWNYYKQLPDKRTSLSIDFAHFYICVAEHIKERIPVVLCLKIIDNLEEIDLQNLEVSHKLKLIKVYHQLILKNDKVEQHANMMQLLIESSLMSIQHMKLAQKKLILNLSKKLFLSEELSCRCNKLQVEMQMKEQQLQTRMFV